MARELLRRCLAVRAPGGHYNIYRVDWPRRVMVSDMDPNDWWESSEADLKAMDLCYNEKLYGLSAYHCQQALEKAIKSAALAHNLQINPKKIGHDVLLSMFKKMVKDLAIKKKNGLVTEAQYSYFQRTLDLLESVSGSIETGTDERTAKEIISAKNYFWGRSLRIKVNNNKYGKFVNETKQFALDALNDTKWVDTPNAWKCASDVRAADLNRLVNKLHRDFGQNINIKKTELYILHWFVPHILTALKIIPHEEYGRYPGSLKGLSRKELYRRKHKALRQLQFKVKIAINDLDKNIRNHPKISSKK